MNDNLLTALNDVQREAVQHTEGPLLILAGAGSGKTRVITHRIAYLLKHQGVSPFRILAVTFTNKAANEMKERLDKLVAEGTSRNLWVATFHATCARILRKDIEKLGTIGAGFDRHFTIFDTSEQATLVRDILRQLGLNDKQYNPRTILIHISRAKNDFLTPADFAKVADGYFEHVVARVYPLYQDALRQNNALDFDDLLHFTVELFDTNAEVLRFYQDKFEYLHVDEYQDTNLCQYKLTRLLAGTRQNLCVVGDDDQGIYAFRGADIKNILDFEKDYPHTHVLRLEENYRSTQNILDAAWGIIHNNRHRREKKLWTRNDTGEQVICYEAIDENDEASYVGTKIEEWHAEGVDYSDFAIFYRTNAQSRTFEDALRTANIPYQIVGGVGFYDRREIRDLVAYLRVLCNRNDSMSLRRILNVPARGIGATTLQRLIDFAGDEGISLFASIQRVGENARINRGIQTKVQRFAQIFEEFGGPDELPSEALHHVLLKTGYLKTLEEQESTGNIEAQNRVENIRELINAIAEYESHASEPTLADYLENIALAADIDTLETEQTDRVPLMTLHSAKGLEFPFVFIVGIEEGFLPHQRSLNSEAEMEEERRLCYVGITRAMEQLYLVHARQRRTYGDTEYRTHSRFITEIPEHLIKHVDRYRSPFREMESTYTVDDFTDYKVNEIVVHPKFGRGKITKVSGRREKAFVTVRFTRSGYRQFAAAAAPLRRV